MKTFKVTELQKNYKDKMDESVTKYKAIMKEKVGKGNKPDKLTLESSYPIDYRKKDEIRIDKVAFQKSLRGRK